MGTTGARPKVGVVVVNYGSHHLLRANLDLDRHVPHDVEVVVVDNRTTTAKRHAVRTLAADRGWLCVPMPGNAGFAAAVNAGAAEAFRHGCDCVVLLNPDARVGADVVLELARECRADPMTIAAPRLVDAAGGPHFHGSEVELASGRIRGLAPPRVEGGRWLLGRSRVTGPALPWLTGACLAIHRRLFTLLGGLDERYFLYWEDIDLAYRAARHGARLLVRADLVGRHDEGGTQGPRRGRARSGRYYYFNARNRLRFVVRHRPRADVVRWLLRTPAVSTEILLRGGRRQLLTSPVPLLAITAGSLAGAAHAVRALARPAAAPARPPERTDGALRVTVAMLTFHRPRDLEEVVPLLVEQCRSVTDERTRADVLVVDNDPAGSGVEVLAASGVDGVRWVVEETPGIAAARNRALDECADRDVLVFIDDDERPHAGWLRHLVDTHRSAGADVVAGPVVSAFAGPLDPWVLAGRFFARRRLGTGSPIDVAATSNLLLDMRTVRRTGVRFDQRFGLSGVGEDTLFTRTLVRRGARMVWCDEAIVTDVVPQARATRSWVLRRAVSIGSVSSITHVALHRHPVRAALARVEAAGRGAARCLAGAGRWAVGAVTASAASRARGVRTLCRGAGMLLGAAGVMYEQVGKGDASRTRLRRSAVRAAPA